MWVEQRRAAVGILVAVAIAGSGWHPAWAQEETAAETKQTPEPNGETVQASSSDPAAEDSGSQEAPEQSSASEEAGAMESTEEAVGPPPVAESPATSSAGEETGTAESVETVATIPVQELKPLPQPTGSVVSSNATVLDEIVVTAQRKVQSVLDVPIAMTVVDDKFLAEQGITDLTELSRYLPNTKLRTDLAFGQAANIRGFTRQASNSAFEQAVGLLVDGVSYNENDYFITSLFDVERVEVLRGPQGTLLGKNTTGGLINITTKEPTDFFSGFFDAQTGEVGRQRFDAALGGPLIADALNFRLALNTDARDGVMQNTTAEFVPGAPASVLSRDRVSLRAKLEAPDLFGSRLTVQYERSEVEYLGTAVEFVEIAENPADFLREYDPKLDLEPGNFVGSVDDGGYTKRTVEKLIGRWGGQWGGWGMDVIAGYGNVDSLITGADATPAPLNTFFFDQKKPSFSVEAIGSTTELFGSLDFTGGIFYQNRKLKDYVSQLDINTPVFTRWLAAQSAPPPPGPPAAQGAHEVTTMYFNQNADSLAVYGQTGWHFAQRWTLIGGVRVSQEKKSATWNRTLSDNAVLLPQLLGFEEFTDARNRTEVLSIPKIALQYKPADTASFFLHWAQGFRSGGFNADAGSADGLEFEPEVLTEYAANAKLVLFGGQLRLNLGYFYDELEDFQLVTTDPEQQATITTNAGSARAQGFELDASWAPTDWLTLIATLGTNDAVFTDFKFGPCSRDRPNTDGDADTRCDLTGETPPFVADFTSSLTATFGLPLASIPGIGAISFFDRHGIEFQGGATVEYDGDQGTGIPGDERLTQPSYSRINAHLGFGSFTQGWSFRVTGDNLTNEPVNRGRGMISSSNAIVQQTEPPRLIYGQLRWEL